MKGIGKLKSFGKKALFLFIPFFLFFCLLEWSYRGQWFDYYKNSYHYLNLDFNKEKPSILVFGDSFTANTEGYLENVKDQFGAAYNVVNAAISGTAPRQAYYMASRRIETTSPQLVICQLYLGNDLLDEDLPINWETLSFGRNCYYSIASAFRVTTYLNYKFAQISTSLNRDFDETIDPKTDTTFNADAYSPRKKMLFKAAPNYLNNTYHLNTPLKGAFDQTIDYLKKIQDQLPSGCDFRILVIPDAVAVSDRYAEQAQLLGATDFEKATSYPFIEALKSTFGAHTVWDVTPVFQNAEEKGTPVYFPNDEHLNPNGQDVLGAFVTQQIKTTSHLKD
ncbi:MAG: hypothetical protein CL843_10630 [Crocinitomicaceae bacterium]|nr:hypothetical protein [Crocinitomicaceae bacterium]|tara:strand:+ start:6425 stop:7432 length:1008 start_codon:yes stop_codon:yes gene_type:complete